MSKSLRWLSDRLLKINNSTDEEKLRNTENLFEGILKECKLYVVLLKETTEEELSESRARAYISTIKNLENKSYLRIFTDLVIAKEFARNVGAIKNDKELVIELSKEELILQVKDAFMMVGLDGVMVEDGKQFVTISAEQFLRIGIVNVLNLKDGFDTDFINTIRAIFDIKTKRYRLVVPVKGEGTTKEDIINEKAEVYPINNELLVFEYYDKYKVEKFFKESAEYVDLSFEVFEKVLNIAINNNIEKINMIYAGKTSSASPKNILGLLDVIR